MEGWGRVCQVLLLPNKVLWMNTLVLKRPLRVTSPHQGTAAKDSGEPPTSATLVWASPKRPHGALRSTWEELFITAKSHFCDPLTKGPDFHRRGRVGAALSRQGFSPVQWTNPLQGERSPTLPGQHTCRCVFAADSADWAPLQPGMWLQGGDKGSQRPRAREENARLGHENRIAPCSGLKISLLKLWAHHKNKTEPTSSVSPRAGFRSPHSSTPESAGRGAWSETPGRASCVRLALAAPPWGVSADSVPRFPFLRREEKRFHAPIFPIPPSSPSGLSCWWNRWFTDAECVRLRSLNWASGDVGNGVVRGEGGPQSRPATVPGSQCVNRSAQPRLFADSDLCSRGKGIRTNQSGRFS